MSRKKNPETKYKTYDASNIEVINDLIVDECNRIKELLLEKNVNYNNSLHTQPPLFDVDPRVGLMARINDKLNRIKQVGLNDVTEDSLDDLIGYLIHLRISLRINNNY